MNDYHHLGYFQQQVLEEYELIKGFEKTYRLMAQDRSEKKGCLSAPFELLAQRFVNWTLEKEHKKRNFEEISREADDLFKQKEISDEICKTISSITRNEILTEEKFVKEMTAALYKNEISKRFVIPETPTLYAMIARRIFKTGLEKFCAEKN